MKLLIDLTTDVQTLDFTELPHYLTDLYVTSDETYYFYDLHAKSIRAVYPNPALLAD